MNRTWNLEQPLVLFCFGELGRADRKKVHFQGPVALVLGSRIT